MCGRICKAKVYMRDYQTFLKESDTHRFSQDDSASSAYMSFCKL